MQGLESLEAWKKSKDFAVKAYNEVLACLPATERWNLDQQIRRSASSAPANIAEGHGRFYYQENVHFCYIARGSLTETYGHISLAAALGYIQADQFKELKQDIEQLIRIINGYIACLKGSKIGAYDPGAGYATREDAAPYLSADLEGLNSLEPQ